MRMEIFKVSHVRYACVAAPKTLSNGRASVPQTVEKFYEFFSIESRKFLYLIQ